jgi:hypothetical protein
MRENGEKLFRRERNGVSELEKLAPATSIQACSDRQVGCLDMRVRGALSSKVVWTHKLSVQTRIKTGTYWKSHL